MNSETVHCMPFKCACKCDCNGYVDNDDECCDECLSETHHMQKLEPIIHRMPF